MTLIAAIIILISIPILWKWVKKEADNPKSILKDEEFTDDVALFCTDDD